MPHAISASKNRSGQLNMSLFVVFVDCYVGTLPASAQQGQLNKCPFMAQKLRSESGLSQAMDIAVTAQLATQGMLLLLDFAILMFNKLI